MFFITIIEKLFIWHTLVKFGVIYFFQFPYLDLNP